VIYVDDMNLQATAGRHASRWSHLFADTEDDLHIFARKLGLRPEWAQYPGTADSHYDVTSGMRQRALRMGAQPVTWREAGEFFAARKSREQEPEIPLPPEPGENEPTLAQQTDQRLREAGITEDDPGLVQVREWNRHMFDREAQP
jgi:hypothetical protein